MSIYYKEGEEKIRAGVFQRYSNITSPSAPAAQDGICAIPIRASWGPLGEVVKNVNGDLKKNYGAGEYSNGFTAPAAQAMFDGGATTVYTYRLGAGGKKAGLNVQNSENQDAVTATAKYEGAFPIVLSILPKLGDASKKEANIYTGTTLVETFAFDADTANEPANLVKACRNSKYIDFALAGDGTGTLANVPEASGALTGGEDPKVTNEDYSKAFEAFEPFYYNCIALDIDDGEDLALSMLLHEYLKNAHQTGKLGIAVLGEKREIAFETRLKHAASFNDGKVVYLGSGWQTASGDQDGVLAICQTAGKIAGTPANQSITHARINKATGLLETFTNMQYESAILSGMLLPSMSNDGDIWYDSGINTLVKPEENQDNGWKKIRRTKTRFEMFDRLDRALLPKVGRVNCDSDGIGDVIQTGNLVLAAMANERKLFAGASFSVERYAADSAWFTIQADDIDSLEKIYLHYLFRFSQE